MIKKIFWNKPLEKTLIIFDMDGLMFDTESLAIKLWDKVGKEFGYEIRPSLVNKTTGIDVNGTEKIFLDHFGDDFPFLKIRDIKGRICTKAYGRKWYPC